MGQGREPGGRPLFHTQAGGNGQGSPACDRQRAGCGDRKRYGRGEQPARYPDPHEHHHLPRADVSRRRRCRLPRVAPVFRSAFETVAMRETSPLNFQRTLLLLGRLALGVVFLYAAYAKLSPTGSKLFTVSSWRVSGGTPGISISFFAVQVDRSEQHTFEL